MPDAGGTGEENGSRGPRERGWSVWRQDDHGKRFEVKRGLAHDEALRRTTEFEARGHKQTYWIEPTG